MADSSVVFVVEDGEVLQEVSDDNVEQDHGDDHVVGDEPEEGHYHVTTVAVQVGAVVLPNLERDRVSEGGEGWREGGREGVLRE